MIVTVRYLTTIEVSFMAVKRFPVAVQRRIVIGMAWVIGVVHPVIVLWLEVGED